MPRIVIFGFNFCQSWILAPLILVKMEDSVVIEAMEHMAAHAKVHTPEKTVRKVSILNEILECSPTAQVDIWKDPRLHS